MKKFGSGPDLQTDEVLSARRPGTPYVILIAATLVFLKNAAIARLLRGVILYDL